MIFLKHPHGLRFRSHIRESDLEIVGTLGDVRWNFSIDLAIPGRFRRSDPGDLKREIRPVARECRARFGSGQPAHPETQEPSGRQTDLAAIP